MYFSVDINHFNDSKESSKVIPCISPFLILTLGNCMVLLSMCVVTCQNAHRPTYFNRGQRSFSLYDVAPAEQTSANTRRTTAFSTTIDNGQTISIINYVSVRYCEWTLARVIRLHRNMSQCYAKPPNINKKVVQNFI